MATKGVGRTEGNRRGPSSVSGSNSGGKGAKSEASRKVEAAAFTEALSTATEKQEITAELSELLNKLREQGNKLATTPTYPELLEYRSLVRQFLERVVKGVYKVEELRSLRFQENGKVFLIAQKVDEKLEELANEILKDQSTPLSIMTRTDEIRGLLFDLLG